MKKIFLIFFILNAGIFFSLYEGYAATTTYRADGVTALAYEGDADDGAFNDDDSEFTAGEYIIVSTDDSNYVADEAGMIGQYKYHRYAFTVSEEINSIDQVDITFKGIGGSLPNVSFPGAEFVATDQGAVSFEDLFALWGNGEKLPSVTYYSQGAQQKGQIAHVFRYDYSGDMLELKLSNNKSFHVTPYHDVLISDQEDLYKSAGDLQVGDALVTGTFERAQIIGKNVYFYEGYVYDISVKEFHNFLLDAGIVVHNAVTGSAYSFWVKENSTWTEKESGNSTDTPVEINVQYSNSFSDLISDGILEVAWQSDVLNNPQKSRVESNYIEVVITYTAAAQPITTRIGRSGFRVNKGTTLNIRR